MTVLALPSFNTLDFRIDSYNLYSFPNSLLTKYFFIMSIAGESTPLNVSIVTCLTNSSNKMPEFAMLDSHQRNVFVYKY